MGQRERCLHCGCDRTYLDEHQVVRCRDCGKSIYDNPNTSSGAGPADLRVTSVSMGGAVPVTDSVRPYAREELEELERIGPTMTYGEFRRLLATAKQGLEDSTRLDWLEVNEGVWHVRTEGQQGWCIVADDQLRTLRGAIDAVRMRSGLPADSNEKASER